MSAFVGFLLFSFISDTYLCNRGLSNCRKTSRVLQSSDCLFLDGDRLSVAEY